MPIDGGYVGMVDRAEFDEWLRERAERAGAVRFTGKFEVLTRGDDGLPCVHLPRKARPSRGLLSRAASSLARTARIRGREAGNPGSERGKFVFAYHEIVEAPVDPATGAADNRCEIYYRGPCRRTFYAWIFPHGPR